MSHSVMEYRTLELATCAAATHTELQFLNNFIIVKQQKQ